MRRGRVSGAGLLMAALGCTTNFKYVPSPRASDAAVVTVPIAFQGFEDRTREVSDTHGTRFGPCNIVQTPCAAWLLPVLLPGQLGLNFTEELNASGLFAQARYLSPGERPGTGGVLVTGTVQRAFLDPRLGTGLGTRLEMIFTLEASRPGAPPYRREHRFVDDPGNALAKGATSSVPRLQDFVRRAFNEMSRALAEGLRSSAASDAAPASESADAILRRMGSGP